MKMENVFYPMTEIPVPDKGDASFSKTVIIYGEDLESFEFGYFDFEQDQWSHFGKNNMLLKCWCYVPVPDGLNHGYWHTLKPKGYIKPLF